MKNQTTKPKIQLQTDSDQEKLSIKYHNDN